MSILDKMFGKSKNSTKEKGKNEITCSACEQDINLSVLKNGGSCPSCNSVPIEVDTIESIGILMITNNEDESKWLLGEGKNTAYVTACPKLSMALYKKDFNNYKGGLVVTSDEISESTKWYDNAKQLVEYNNNHTVMVQHGTTLTMFPSGQRQKCGIIIMVVSTSDWYRKSVSEPAPMMAVAINREIVPI